MSNEPAAPPARSYALAAICLCFVASAGLRGADMAVTLLIPPGPSETVRASAAPAVPSAAMPDPVTPGGGSRIPFSDPGLTSPEGRRIVAAAARTLTPAPGGSCEAEPLFAALRERSLELDARETRLDERAARIEAAAKRVETRLAALKEARAELEETVAHVEKAQSRDIDHLVTMYETMKPKGAGDLFNVMDVHFASEFLARMKPEVAASIMANMDPENAYAASLSLARRNENAPQE